MLGEIFYWVFNMSIMGTFTGIIILLLGYIKRIPRRMIYALWIIPFIRFLVPIGLDSKYSFMNLLSELSIKTTVAYEYSAPSYYPYSPSMSMMNSVGAAESYFPITYKTNVLEGIFNTSAIIWLCVVLFLFIVFLCLYIKTILNNKTAIHFKDNIYTCESTPSPAVYGIVKPKIIIPVAFRDADLTYIIAHESIHIKRMDNLRRILAIITAVIHWFNPFAWLFLKCFLQDMEHSCDEAVVKNLSLKEKKDYALSLLNILERKAAFSSPFGGANLSSRIKNILSYKRLSLFSLICFVLLSCMIFYTLLTNAL
ncbi:MAG: peptidase M56 BlaR1 [Clostridia bacterium]|nr:peptidase M56 BlaR1 [Clostridia bacterium]